MEAEDPMSANQDTTGSPAHVHGAEEFTPASGQGSRALRRCLSLDLEVGVRDRRIRGLAGVRPDTGQCLTVPAVGHGLAAALAKLDDLADGVDYLLGHNLIAFDLSHLQAANPGLRLLRLPAVDTLRLNPLAYPRNPYHHLVKHYQADSSNAGVSTTLSATPTTTWSSITRADSSNAGVSTTLSWMPGLRWRSSTTSRRPCAAHRPTCWQRGIG